MKCCFMRGVFILIIFAKRHFMQKALIYLVIGTVLSFVFNHYVSGNGAWWVDWYYGLAFGLGWAMAYFVDEPQWQLSKKMGVSFIGVGILLLIGFAFFNFEIAVPSIIRFFTVFVAYYLIASFRESKSLRK